MTSSNKSGVSIEKFENIFVEVREELSPAAVPRKGSDLHAYGLTQQQAAEKFKQESEKELQKLSAERFSNAIAGAAIQPSRHGFLGVTFLRGRMGAGKSTFLKIAAHAALKAHRRNSAEPFPIYVNKDPEIAGASGEEVPTALADAALRTVEMATYSRAASYLRSKISRQHPGVVLFLDTVDGWTDESFSGTVRWLRDKNVRAIIAARRFPFDPREMMLSGRISLYEILGIPPGSVCEFLQGHFQDFDPERVLDALDQVPNSGEWRTNPFLLTLVGNLVHEGFTLEKHASTLTLYKRRIQSALDRVTDGRSTQIEAILKRIAREELCTTPARFFFPRSRIPREAREEVFATNLINGNQTLEFAHLSVGEYLAAQPPIDLAAERLRLLDTNVTWQHHLEVLAMGHAQNGAQLESALVEAKVKDIEHRRLMLVVRAVAYGGSEVERFCADHGNEIIGEVAKRLALPSACFGDAERALMRATERASRFLKHASIDQNAVPQDGEPGAEVWALTVSLGKFAQERPVESYWWPTIYHQARALLEREPDEVWRQTQGGDIWECRDALEALAEDDELSSLLTHRHDRIRQDGIERRGAARASARHLGMLTDESEWVRLRAVQRQPDEFWSTPSAQVALESIIVNDPSALVRSEAIKHLEPDRILPELLEELRELVRPRKTIQGSKQWLLSELLKRFAAEPTAKQMIDTFLSSGDGWFCPKEAYRALCQDGERATILQRRLESDMPHFEEIRAAEGIERFVEPLRGIIRRFLHEPSKYHLLAAAIENLPANDEPSRAHRLVCLTPTHIPRNDTHWKSKREQIQSAAIRSFAQDAESVSLLRRFLEPIDGAPLAAVTLRAVGRYPEFRDLVWQQLREGEHNARLEAARILGENPNEHSGLQAYLDEISSKTERDLFETRYVQATIIGALGNAVTTERLLRYIDVDDPIGPVREKSVDLLMDREEAQDELKKRIFMDLSSSATRVRLWKKFAQDAEIRDKLRIRSREDQWEVRHAYFTLLSQDEARLGALRAHLRERQEHDRNLATIAEMIGPLVRDKEAQPDLRKLVDSKSIAVRATLLHALKADSALRTEAHQLLRHPEWIRSFWPNAPELFARYFENDLEAKGIILTQLDSDQLGRGRGVAIPVMRGYGPATLLLRRYTQDKDENVADAARAALIGESDIRDELIGKLRSDEKWDCRRAAEILESVPEAQEKLAELTADSEEEVRRVAYRARVHQGISTIDLRTLLAKESEDELRGFLIEAIGDHLDEETRDVLRERVASDPAVDPRTKAASRLRRAEPGHRCASTQRCVQRSLHRRATTRRWLHFSDRLASSCARKRARCSTKSSRGYAPSWCLPCRSPHLCPKQRTL